MIKRLSASILVDDECVDISSHSTLSKCLEDILDRIKISLSDLEDIDVVRVSINDSDGRNLGVGTGSKLIHKRIFNDIKEYKDK